LCNLDLFIVYQGLWIFCFLTMQTAAIAAANNAAPDTPEIT